LHWGATFDRLPFGRWLQGMAIEGRLVCYSGHVQGVGFRYSTLRIAQGFSNIVGYVTNLPDGCVEIAAEGPSADMDMFFADVSRVMGEYIRDVKVRPRPACGSFVGFTIR